MIVWSRNGDDSPPISPIPVETYLDLISELTHYKDRCLRAEEECINLKRERRERESLYALAKSRPNDVPKILIQNSRQIDSWRKKAQLRKDLEPYLDIGDANCGTSAIQHILPHFCTIKARISTISVLKVTSSPRLGTLYNNSVDLDLLLTTIFDASFVSRVEPFSDCCSAFTFSDLIQGLTGAAINQWVFQCEYRSYATTITPLLQKYRQHLATLCMNLTTFVLHALIHSRRRREALQPRYCRTPFCVM